MTDVKVGKNDRKIAWVVPQFNERGRIRTFDLGIRIPSAEMLHADTQRKKSILFWNVDRLYSFFFLAFGLIIPALFGQVYATKIRYQNQISCACAILCQRN